MASPRTRKRKQQRRKLRAYLAESRRWHALTPAQRQQEDPERVERERRAAIMTSIMKNTYLPMLKDMLRNSVLLSARYK